MTTLILSKEAEKDFAKLPKKDRKKVIKKLKILQGKPSSGKTLSEKLKSLWSLRAWPYRIIYNFKKTSKIAVHRILHRQRAYK